VNGHGGAGFFDDVLEIALVSPGVVGDFIGHSLLFHVARRQRRVATTAGGLGHYAGGHVISAAVVGMWSLTTLLCFTRFHSRGVVLTVTAWYSKKWRCSSGLGRYGDLGVVRHRANIPGLINGPANEKQKIVQSKPKIDGRGRSQG